MIIDCFPVFAEIDVLDIRLHELSEVVDVFAISEATLTFSGKPKPLYFEENRERFGEFADRIEYFVIDSYNGIDTGSGWGMDYGQKQRALDMMLAKLSPGSDDLVLLSDYDEIPKAEKVKLANQAKWAITKPEMNLFYYWLNCRCIDRRWTSGAWVRPGGVLNHRELRYGEGNMTMQNSGWHFGYLGDIQRKIKASSHEEYDKPPYNMAEYIADKRNTGTDLYNREHEYEFLDDLSYLPKYVLANMDKFEKHIYGKGSM